MTKMTGNEVAEFLPALRLVLGLDPIEGHRQTLKTGALSELDRTTIHIMSKYMTNGNRRIKPAGAAK